MTTRERILALRLLEKQDRNPEYTEKIGVQVTVKKNSEGLNGEEERCLK